MSKRPSFLAVWGVTAGLVPMLASPWVHEATRFAFAQLSFWRATGLMLVGSCLTLAASGGLAALLTVLGRADGADHRRATWVGATLAIAAFLLVGAGLFLDLSPTWEVGAAALVLGAAAVLRNEEAGRRVLLVVLAAPGLVLVLAPLVASPGVAWQWHAYTARLAGVPQVPLTLARAEGAPKRIVLITFDGLRYASTSFADPRADLTPSLAAIAREGTVFTACHASSDRTIVSLPSLLSGVPPHEIYREVRNRSGLLRKGLVPGVGRALAPAGYAAYYATSLVEPSYFGLASEFAEGVDFNLYLPRNRLNGPEFLPLGAALDMIGEAVSHDHRDPPSRHMLPAHAIGRTFDGGLRLLAAHPDRTFLWIHVGAPHEPYVDIPLAEAHRARPLGYPERLLEETKDADLPALKRAYEHYVHFADARLGDFVAEMKAAGLWDDTMVVVSSDHGEAISSELKGHGQCILTDEVTHVPLVVRAPDGPRGRRIDATVGGIDVVPTILARVYDEVPPGFAGADLLGPLPPARLVTTWSDYANTIELEKPHAWAQGAIAAFKAGRHLTLERRFGWRLRGRHATAADQALSAEVQRLLRL